MQWKNSLGGQPNNTGFGEWQSLRQGFFRRAFREGDGDIIMGVPREMERMLTTAPYFRSSFTVSPPNADAVYATLGVPELIEVASLTQGVVGRVVGRS
jgi:hypothetical protein